MQHRLLTTLFFTAWTFGLPLAGAAEVKPDDLQWPWWRGPYSNGTAIPVEKPLSAKPRVLWHSTEFTKRTSGSIAGSGKLLGGCQSLVMHDDKVYCAYYIGSQDPVVFDQKATTDTKKFVDDVQRLIEKGVIDGQPTKSGPLKRVGIEDLAVVQRMKWNIHAEDVMVCFDASTGKTLWKTAVPGAVIATGASAILRTADGEPIIENLPAPIAPPLPAGASVFFTCGSGESSGGASRYRIDLAGSGRDLTATIAWAFVPDKHKGTPWFAWMKEHHPDAPIEQFPYGKAPTTDVGCILDGDRLLYGGNPMTIIDATTGKVLKDPGKVKLPGMEARGHLTRAGGYLVNTAHDYWVRLQDLADPAKVVGANPTGSEWHRQVQLGGLSIEDAVKAIKEEPWLPTIGDWATLQTTVWPQGDRLYIRSKDSLFCIGDPAKGHHTPAGTPAAATTGD